MPRACGDAGEPAGARLQAGSGGNAAPADAPPTCTTHLGTRPTRQPLPPLHALPRRVVPRSKLESVVQHGLGYAWASFWLPAWGDCCLTDPACSPVGEMRLVPDATGAPLFSH